MFQILSLVILFGTSYVLGIFFAPTQTDEIADLVGAKVFNETIRGLKTSADGVSTSLIELQSGTGGVLDTLKQAKGVVQTGKQVIESKVDQTKQVIQSVEQVGNAVNQLQTNVSTLTTLTGSATLSGSTMSGAAT